MTLFFYQRCFFITALALLGLATSPTNAHLVHGQHHDPGIVSASPAEGSVPADAVEPRPNTKIALAHRDPAAPRVVGTVTWFNTHAVGYTDKEGHFLQISWVNLSPQRLSSFISRLPDLKDVQALMVAAEVVATYSEDERSLDRLLQYAVRADSSHEEKAQSLREKQTQRIQNPSPDDPQPSAAEDQPDNARKQPPAAAANRARPWPELTQAQNEQAIEDMIQFTDAALGKMGHQMVSTQTKRFIVYSDMSQEESKYWISLVDKMYDRLTETFDLDKSDNIWRGKCLLLFFKNEADYHRYNQAAYGRALQGSAGVCRTMGNGEVHILMRQSRDRDSTGYILVHEAVHGFLARYQSSIHVQSWLNEGLAEFVSEQLVKAGVVERKKRSAREIVKRSGRIRDFLTARNIDFEYYGMAYDITDMMIQENRKGYVKMIQGIKNGLTVQQAFETEYGVPLDKVFDYYAKTRLEIEHLKLN